MAAKGGLFAVSMGPPAAPEDEDTTYDVADDAKPVGEEEPDSDDAMAGPFDAYAETVFDPNADTATKASALREAILCILEERGGR